MLTQKKNKSKALGENLEETLPFLIPSHQTTYAKKCCISESGEPISELIETCDKLSIPRSLVTMDIETAFVSLDHSFLLSAF